MSPATTCSTSRWALVVRDARGVEDAIEIEMLEGMAHAAGAGHPSRRRAGCCSTRPSCAATTSRRRSPTSSAGSTRTPRPRTSCAGCSRSRRARRPGVTERGRFRRAVADRHGPSGAAAAHPGPRRGPGGGRRRRCAVRQRARHRLHPRRQPPVVGGRAGDHAVAVRDRRRRGRPKR